MELVKYDKQKRTVTIEFSKEEFVDIHSALGGVLNTYERQDPLIIDVPQERLDEVCEALYGILKQLNAIILRK